MNKRRRWECRCEWSRNGADRGRLEDVTLSIGFGEVVDCLTEYELDFLFREESAIISLTDVQGYKTLDH